MQDPTRNPSEFTQRGHEIFLMTPKEAGHRLGVSESSAYRLIANGELRAVDVAPEGSTRSKTRVRSDDLAAYIERRTTDAPTARCSA